MSETVIVDEPVATASPISPWTYRARVESPDGRFTARFKYEGEVCQGGPVHGKVKLSIGKVFESCNSSLVWSSDSKYLAVPQWVPYRDQRLLIIDAEFGTAELLPEVFRVLELHSFRDGVVEGIDSPVHEPTRVSIKTRR